jgi:hypothetical protein
MPATEIQFLADVLRSDAHALMNLAVDLARAADLKRSERRRPRGFQILKDWDGSGVITDRRWRGGRPARRIALEWKRESPRSV